MNLYDASDFVFVDAQDFIDVTEEFIGEEDRIMDTALGVELPIGDAEIAECGAGRLFEEGVEAVDGVVVV